MKLFTIAAAGVALASAASASAQTDQAEIVITDSPTPTAIVRVADLDLGSDAGRQVLAGRIENAAVRVCYENTVDPVGTALMRHNCYDAAVASGFTQMGALVTARAATGSAAGR